MTVRKTDLLGTDGAPLTDPSPTPSPAARWWEDKSFWVTVINAVILIVGMIRGVPVTQSVENKLNNTETQATSAAVKSGENHEQLKQVHAAVQVKN